MRMNWMIGFVALALCVLAAHTRGQCDPLSLGQLELVELFQDPQGFASDGVSGFVGAGELGVLVVDLSDPANPAVVATIDTAGSARALVAESNTLYVADGSAGLAIYDISDPTNAALLGTLDSDLDLVGIALDGSIVYAIDAQSGLRSIDVSDPSQPTQIGQDPDVPDPQIRAARVKLSGDTAVVSYQRFHPDGAPGVRLLNIANPASLVPVGWVSVPGEPSGIAMRGDTLFIADFLGAMLMSFDASDASSPIPLDVKVYNQIVDLTVDGGELYVLTRNSGLQLVDAINAVVLTELGSIATESNAICVDVDGDNAIVLDGGLSVPFDRAAHLAVSDVESCQSQCAPDITDDGSLDVFDVFAFLDAFNRGDPAADFTMDGSLDIFDVFAFLDAFAVGCP